MSYETIIVATIVGGICGFLASLLGSGPSDVTSRLLTKGVAGAILGTWLFQAFGVGEPDTIIGAVVASIVGSMALLVITEMFLRRF